MSSRQSKAFNPQISGQMDDEEIDNIINDMAENDATLGQTWSRILVTKFLQNFGFYNPHKGKENAPSLEKAYAFYEHFTLARHLTQVSAEHKLERAEPGESEPTSLYSPFFTPESQLNEFGVGVALYFSTLRILGIVFLMAGGINVLNILYFSGSDYSAQQLGLSYALKGSAICTQFTWVACTTCDVEKWNTTEKSDNFGIFTDPDSGEITNLVLRNDCERPPFINGMVNYVTLMFLLIIITLLSMYQRRRETVYDEEKQTATDYSIVVQNPPPGANDPDEWNDFFSSFNEEGKKISGITIALDNHKLLKQLIARRLLRKRLKARLPKGTDLDDDDQCRTAAAEVMREEEEDARGCFECILAYTIFPILWVLCLRPSLDRIVERNIKMTTKIQNLLKQEYKVVKVFATFEAESSQRACLDAFSASKLVINGNFTDMVDPITVFDGRVLDVREPVEPNTVRWFDLHVGFWCKAIAEVITLLLTLCMVWGAGYLVARTRERLGSSWSGPLTTVFNTLIPLFVKIFMIVENHNSEDSRQQSLYLKITIFRWVNTAILARFITPFTSTVTDGNQDLIPTIANILISELYLSPLLRLIDIMGNLKKHLLAPRARTQEQMNLYFQGTPYNVAERYTDMTKVMFVCMFYSAIFPTSLLFAGGILLVQYYVDKYCVMRIWSTAPFLGKQLAVFSRRYFFSAALVAFALAASYDWAQFPYDNLCDAPDNQAQEGFAGEYNQVELLDGTVLDSITVTQDENSLFCAQHWRASDAKIPFPAVPTQLQTSLDWMTDSQEQLATVYGWTGFGLAVAFVIIVFGGRAFEWSRSFMIGTYKPTGKDAMIDFQNVPEISLYVPQFDIPAFPFNLLACDVDDFNKDWIGWRDSADSTYDSHNLIYDVDYDGMKRRKNEDSATESERSRGPVFSIVKSWTREQVS